MLFPWSVYAQEKKAYIVTTTGMIGDVVKNIGGGIIGVKNIINSGVDPHLYRPTGSDIRALNQADIVFYNGHYLEGRMESILKKMARSRAVYAVTENIDAPLIYADENTVDPHMWMDVSLWRKVAQFIYVTLKQHLPQAESLDDNFKRYDEKLMALHEKITAQILSIPRQKRILVTAHDAFSYFGRAYDIRVIALQGINTEDEFGINDMIRLQNVIIKNKVKSIFLESSVPAKFMKSLRKGLLQKNTQVSIGGELFSDAMGKSGTIEGTYIGMLSHNANIITQNLQ